MQIRVTSYNYLNLYDKIDDPGVRDEGTREKPLVEREAGGQVLRELDSDVVSFQEIEKGSLLRAELDRELPGRYPGLAHVEGNDERSSDVALATKHKIAKFTSHKDHTYTLPGSDEVQKFRRDLSEVDIELPGGIPLKVFTVHFKSKRGGAASDIIREGEARQARKLIKESVADLPHKNYLVMGDFNDTPETPTAKAFTEIDADGWGMVDIMAKSGNSAPTYPTGEEDAAKWGRKRIDFIMTSPELAEKLTSVAPHQSPATYLASDHFPLTATFDL
jgi:endonuclease/exonuclease/phosphatase family metal-dependent hydrolase